MAHTAVLRAFRTDWRLRKLSSAHKTSNPGNDLTRDAHQNFRFSEPDIVYDAKLGKALMCTSTK